VTEGAFENRSIVRHGYALGTYYTKAVVATVADTTVLAGSTPLNVHYYSYFIIVEHGDSKSENSEHILDRGPCPYQCSQGQGLGLRLVKHQSRCPYLFLYQI
jgi:hypothetical protein